MARTIRHEPYQLIVRRPARHECVKHLANPLDNLEVAPLVTAPNIVRLTKAPPLGNKIECSRMIFDVKPVANVLPVAVNREFPVGERIDDGEGNKLFRKVIRSIIVRAVRKQDGHSVRSVPSFSEMIR